MRTLILSIALLASLVTGCKSIECGPGTIDRGGTCSPAEITTSSAKCGPFTMLLGDQCAPQFPPTQCDPASTIEDKDPATGVITCIGTGTGGCAAPFPCPAPAAGKQTICGQLYDLETSQPFAATGATGATCTSSTTAGPCALAIKAYDAIAFGSNPATAQPLTNGGIAIDDCGRYRVADIDVGGSVFIGLGLDDASSANLGPMGVTNAVGWATPKQTVTPTKDLDGWVAPLATTTKWQTSGGPPISGGIYVGIFRAHKTGEAVQAGVSFVKPTTSAMESYFLAAQTARQTVDPSATATGANGTGLLVNASLADGGYTGTGGLTDTVDCAWEGHAALALPYIVFVQVFRPEDTGGHTCPL